MDAGTRRDARPTAPISTTASADIPASPPKTLAAPSDDDDDDDDDDDARARCSSRANRLDPEYPNYSPPNAANTTGFGATPAPIDPAAAASAAEYAFAAASVAINPDRAPFASRDIS